MEITGVKDIDNIIFDYKYQIEIKEKKIKIHKELINFIKNRDIFYWYEYWLDYKMMVEEELEQIEDLYIENYKTRKITEIFRYKNTEYGYLYDFDYSCF
jgi:hypothetical protein